MQAINFNRVTVNGAQMGGIPCVRNLRIPVATVVGMIAEGMSRDWILDAYPDLEAADVAECLQYAAEAVRERQLLRLKNKTAKLQRVWLEPLGDKISLEPDVLYELTAGDEFGKVEIDLAESGFVLYGWVTSIHSIDEDGDAHLEWALPAGGDPNHP